MGKVPASRVRRGGVSEGKEAGDCDGRLILREESAAMFYLSRGVPNEPLRGHGVMEKRERE